MFKASVRFCSNKLYSGSFPDAAKNLVNPLHWVQASPAAGIGRFLRLFNAACVKPLHSPMQERHLLVTLKLHGRTRLMINQTRRDHGKARVLKTPALPCFNSASASPKGALGQAHWLASLVQGLGSLRYNLYNWTALSAQEAVDAARCMTGWPMALPEGESAQRVAGITLVRQRWEWEKQFAALPILVEHTLISQQKTQND